MLQSLRKANGLSTTVNPKDIALEDISESVFFQEVKMIFLGEDTTPITTFIEMAMDEFSAEKADKGEWLIDSKEQKVCFSFTQSCGRKMFQSLTTTFFRNTSVIFLVYLFDDLKTTECLDFWLKEIERYSDSSAPKYLLGFGNTIDDCVYNKANAFAVENMLIHKVIELKDLPKSFAFFKTMIDSLVEPLVSEEPTKEEKTHNSCCVVF
ncbi:hypothetical protein EIN_111680 [Entamoeba invadens IP1]|uniref:Uncharacterized protein n=1 Tax=Entamoeba invadens IP1 TaxID=370355 RepID=A0A0A1U3R1_ENTIV|nr:hypothetical protein EIN_111680 [Entamoeba invadens IP1]ELP86234.1 hypothetical protein EIN_111680 [Entamoeba invadens IP1]|eukprot:XP_004185580.1 hypothetical protein EIN_111680 [Entamoeba invadens IP1]